METLQRDAFNWADLQAQLNHLSDLMKSDTLNSEQENYCGGYYDHLSDSIENIEDGFFYADDTGEYHQEVRSVANALEVRPSSEFLSHLKEQLESMQLDGVEFQIKKAVENYNLFSYSCAIYVTESGYVGFNGCKMESSNETTVLFNKHNKKTVSIEDVKKKLEKVS